MNDYCIRFIPLPFTTKGVTVEDTEGFFNIYINSELSSDAQQDAIRHELNHISRDDFDAEKSLREAETM